MSFGSFARASSTSAGLGSFCDSTAKIVDFSKERVSGTRVSRGTVDGLLDELSRGGGGSGRQEREGRREGGRGEAERGTGHHAT